MFLCTWRMQSSFFPAVNSHGAEVIATVVPSWEGTIICNRNAYKTDSRESNDEDEATSALEEGSWREGGYSCHAWA